MQAPGAPDCAWALCCDDGDWCDHLQVASSALVATTDGIELFKPATILSDRLAGVNSIRAVFQGPVKDQFAPGHSPAEGCHGLHPDPRFLQETGGLYL